MVKNLKIVSTTYSHTPQEYLDMVLICLLYDTPPIQTALEICDKILKQENITIEEKFVIPILEQLVKDGFCNYEDREVHYHTHINLPEHIAITRYYLLTFQGRFFINDGGYVERLNQNQKHEREAKELQKSNQITLSRQTDMQKWMLRVTWILAIGTLIPAYYYVMLIGKYYHWWN